MASSFGDLGRLINGVSLIAKEIAARSKALQSARTGDFQALVKAAVVSATDISGLTRGRVRVLPSAGSTPPARPKESVVVFYDDQDTRLPETSSSVGGAAPEENAVFRDREAEVSVPRTSADVPGNSNRIDDQSVCLPDSRGRGDSGVPNESGETKDIRFSSLGEGREEVAVTPPKRRRPRERRVPSTPFSRALGFAGLGAGLAWGTIQESTKRLVYGTPKSQDKQSVLSPYLSEKNAERLALALCRMRGAALKIGQMLSIQDETLVPAPILAALDIVRQGADVMPRSQLNHVLDAEFGSVWSSKLTSFDYEPLAAASIGQVHRAVTKDGLEVAMKIQYPGVADSIESDIDNVKLLLNYTNLIPSGLYLDRAIKVAKEELSRECDYNLEATNQKRFRNLLSNAEGFYVPLVVENISSKRVITTELVTGIPIDKVALLSQETRDYVGKKLLELTLKELFIFRFMQTDPNWSNFLYDEVTRSINLIDFGAARDFPKSFVDDYFKMVIACANCDRDVVIQASQRMGFLTGEESEIMLEAHVQAGFIVGLPFSKPGGYDFRSTTITQSISNLGATMLKHRLTPPPDEAYSLHRKLAGAFLACIKLGAVVPCRELLLQVHEHYQFGEGDASILSSSPAS